MQYLLYNEGWLLESVEKYQEEKWELSGLSEKQVAMDAAEQDPFINEWGLTITECSSAENGYIFKNGRYGKLYTSEVMAMQEKFNYVARYESLYYVLDGKWQCEYAMIYGSEYTPTYSLPIDALDDDVRNLEIKGTADGTHFDSIEYLRAESSGCSEWRYYMGKKNWFFGTENYLVCIPLSFSVIDEPTWSYDQDSVSVQYQGTEWDIIGLWSCNIESSMFGAFRINMQIDSVFNTNDPKEYLVNLSCDASNSDWPTYCRTNGIVQARLAYSWPGYYDLVIDNPNGTNDYSWNGVFHFHDAIMRLGIKNGFFWSYYDVELQKTA